MKSPVNPTPPAPGLVESGLANIDSALNAMRSFVDSLAWRDRSRRQTSAPLSGPLDVDSAVSDFCNRLYRIWRLSRREGASATAFGQEALKAARQSFGYVDSADPSHQVLPIQLALSVSSLIVQQARRAGATYGVTGPERYPTFVSNVAEMFDEFQLFLGLEYQNLIERYKARLKQAPQDDATRLELGRTLTKCGLYMEAVGHLLEAARNPGVRTVALREASVALFRAGKFEEAARIGNDALAANTHDDRARAWLWLISQNLGGYPDFVPPEHRMEMRVGNDATAVRFEDIAARIGLDKTSAGRGIAVFDYDNDGLLDVVISAAHGGCSLYHNNGDGTFTDVSIGSGIDTAVNTFVIAVGDYNNDGFEDLFITRLGFYGGECQLFRNNGDGTFTDVTQKAGLEMWGPSFIASWVDYDCDGWLDLFVTNNLGGLFDRKTPNRLFRNNRNGTFTEVTDAAGISTPWPTIGAAWGDYDNDGFPDLFVSNAMGRSQLYRNNGDGTFTDVSEEAGVTALGLGSVAFFCDYNNDGLLDIVQLIWSDHEDVIHTMRDGEAPPDAQPLRIYQNNGDGTFTLRNRGIGITGCWGSMSGNAGDFNNDGYLDLLLGNGSPRMDRLDPVVILESDGKRFRNTTFAAGLPFSGKGHGCNLADLFGDGRLSLLVAGGGAYPGDLLTTGVYCPTRLPGNYLNVRLAGVQSNRSAIGARVCVEAGRRKQYREVGGGSNFGCLPHEQHFGLADVSTVDSLDIRWPSGIRQRFEGLPINITIQITEGADSWTDVYASRQSKHDAVHQQ